MVYPRTESTKVIAPLLGLGCSPVLVKGKKQTFLKWIGRALRRRLIQIPAASGSINWKWPSTPVLPVTQKLYPRLEAAPPLSATTRNHAAPLPNGKARGVEIGSCSMNSAVVRCAGK
jgi:hypothetical protein